MQTIDDEEEYLQGLRQAMRYLHTLNVHYVLVHNVHYASLRSKNLIDKSGHDNKTAIC